MYNDLKNEKIIVEINNLIENSKEVRDDIDLYCEFIKERILMLSSMN